MKPKDLKLVYTWEERRPLFSDGIFYVPRYYKNHEPSIFPGWEHIFDNTKPVCLEYGSGNGDWIVLKAKDRGDLNWAAVEVRFDRIKKIWSKIKNHKLSNIFAICGDAYTFTHHYIPPQSVDYFYINFPEPWPKKRHAKHRLINQNFLDEIARVAKDGATLMLVSDDRDYMDASHALIEKNRNFITRLKTTSFPDYGYSWFEALWKSKGKQIYYHQYECRTYF